ncbi:unnamed protein product, partial [Polarella glacialis]
SVEMPSGAWTRSEVADTTLLNNDNPRHGSFSATAISHQVAGPFLCIARFLHRQKTTTIKSKSLAVVVAVVVLVVVAAARRLSTSQEQGSCFILNFQLVKHT